NFSADTLMKRASVLRLTTHLKLTLILLNRLCGATVPEELIREYERSRLLRKLFRVCVHSINRTKKTEYTLRERFDKTVFRFMLAEGFSGKTDTVISIVTRYFFRMVSKQGFRMRERIDQRTV
ncbi:MAG: hypothetical protein R6W78_10720, partial [Bacteroidales bacterium]